MHRPYYGGEARRGESGWSLVLPNATIPYDDGKEKTLYERFEHPDVEDVFELAYKTGKIEPITDTNYDPGRIRIDALFFATYGATAKDVERSLVSVKVGGKWFAVHQKIKAPLERVAARIDDAMKRDTSLAKFFESPGGTFNWRKIAGSDELSMHAWAIAIDLDTKRANYWRNAPQDPLCGRTRTRRRSSMRSRPKASCGAVAGITSTRCTSSTAPSCSIRAATASGLNRHRHGVGRVGEWIEAGLREHALHALTLAACRRRTQ